MYGQFLVIFALLLTGYFCRKINLINEEMSRGLSRFIIHVALPCFIFCRVSGIEILAGLWKEFLIAWLFSMAAIFIAGVYAFWYAKIRRFPKEDATTTEVSVIFPNNGFMGFPIAYIFFGDIGLLYIIANNIALNFTMFSYGVFILRRDSERKFSLSRTLKCFLNPNIVALTIGFAFCYWELSVPEMINTYLTYIGGVAMPMAMIVIGSMLMGTDMLKVIKDREVFESVINKNIVMPVLAYLLVIFFPLPDMVKAMVVFGSCFPTATTVSILVESEGKNSVLASKILVVSTAVSIISLPVAVNLINLLIL